MITDQQVRAALPKEGFLKEYVDYAESVCADAPLLYHVGVGLSILAQFVPKDLSVELGDLLYGNLFVLLTGPSGGRKTIAIKIGHRIMKETFKDKIMEHPGSPQALIDMLRDNPQRILIYEEFGAFLASTENSNLTPVKTLLLDCWDCSPLGRALVKRQKGPVNDARLSVLGGCAPGLLERHSEMIDWTDGFFARWLVFDGRKTTKGSEIPKSDPSKRALVTALLKVRAEEEGFNSYGECQGLSEKAKAIWADWYGDIEDQLAKLQYGATVAALNRSAAHALKLAMVLSWDFGEARANGGDWQITEKELVPALALTNFHVESFKSVVSNIAPSRAMQARREVLHAVGNEPTSIGEISLRAHQLKDKFFFTVLDTLVEQGFIRRLDAEVGDEMKYVRVHTLKEKRERKDAEVIDLSARLRAKKEAVEVRAKVEPAMEWETEFEDSLPSLPPEPTDYEP